MGTDASDYADIAELVPDFRHHRVVLSGLRPISPLVPLPSQTAVSDGHFFVKLVKTFPPGS